jgi:hypothetical protein
MNRESYYAKATKDKKSLKNAKKECATRVLGAWPD